MPSQLQPSPAGLPAGVRFVGHAIVSADGMIASADGSVPEALRNDADWKQFQAALDASALVVLGRLGHQRHPNPGRRRLVFTGSVAGIAPDPADPLATLFNPRGATLDRALAALGIDAGTVAVTGGTLVFAYFLPLYHAFALAEAQQVALTQGRPCFPHAHPRSALAGAGLQPERFEVIDALGAVTLTRWVRPSHDA
ncbi:MAG: dihydrofolate reductase [Devosia sp.]|nr:dihydrofolate reductase [Devosia sp.]